ncbi:hypothetical protein BDN67DRAFT_660484 [Paxillus ammoniavirescens]|nr:hypothetical protein BDN67DRAFT_660484 [Paxillus ammoniavirescens]
MHLKNFFGRYSVLFLNLSTPRAARFMIFDLCYPFCLLSVFHRIARVRCFLCCALIIFCSSGRPPRDHSLFPTVRTILCCFPARWPSCFPCSL